MSAAHAPLPDPVRRTIANAGARLAVREWPRKGAPTVVLVHGYPDNSHIWDAVIAELLPEFHVAVYDVRGAGASSRPKGLACYTLEHLADDLDAVVEAVSPEQPVHLVGHDWGSIQSWEAVTTPEYQNRFASFTTISGPCLDHVGHWARERLTSGDREAVLATLRQLLSSWYIGAFHVPVLSSLAWTLGGRLWPRLVEALEGHRPDRNPTQTADGRAGMALYRANILPRLLRPRERIAPMPVHMIEARNDAFVTPALLDAAVPFVPQLRRYAIAGGHWLIESHAPQVAQVIRQAVRGA